MPANHSEIEKKLWASADELRANSNLKSSEYSVPMLGLIFLRFADQRFAQVERELAASVPVGSRRTRRNANLRKTRDLLLPKLISGEVDVERLEVDGRAVKV